jgi:hypothetical protein
MSPERNAYIILIFKLNRVPIPILFDISIIWMLKGDFYENMQIKVRVVWFDFELK